MSESNSGTNGNGTNDTQASGTPASPGSPEASEAPEKAGKRRGVVRMTASAPFAAKRAVALEPGTSAAVRIEAGRRAVLAASGRATRLARTAWTVVALRKAAAAAATGAGVGLAVVGVGSYALGRRAERRARGPLTRLTGGRF